MRRFDRQFRFLHDVELREIDLDTQLHYRYYHNRFQGEIPFLEDFCVIPLSVMVAVEDCGSGSSEGGGKEAGETSCAQE